MDDPREMRNAHHHARPRAGAIRRWIAINGVLLAVFALAGCALKENLHVEVPGEALACETVADCTVEHLACADCGTPIARRFALQYRAERDRLCRRYEGPVYDCPEAAPLRCQEHRCVQRFDWQMPDQR